MEPCLFRHGKPGPRPHPQRLSLRLQWSHVFSDMVRNFSSTNFSAMRAASMEPCLFRHGKRRRPRPARRDRTEASMEPCLFRHGKQLHMSVMRLTSMASMEPCLFRHGKRCCAASSVPDTICASMEPCLFRHGKDIDPITMDEYIKSFNGAMSFQTW